MSTRTTTMKTTTTTTTTTTGTGRLITTILLMCGAAMAGHLSGCASGPAASGGGPSTSRAVAEGRAEPGAEGLIHRVTEADLATTRGSQPVEGQYVKLWVNGMGCPQCVTNIDFQLERRLSATDVRVDLGEGVVYARFPRTRPTPDQLRNATTDAGLTLVKVVSSSTPID